MPGRRGGLNHGRPIDCTPHEAVSSWRNPLKNGWTGKNGVWRTSTNPFATSRWGFGKESRAPWRWSTLPIILSLPLCPTFRGCPPRWSGIFCYNIVVVHCVMVSWHNLAASSSGRHSKCHIGMVCANLSFVWCIPLSISSAIG